MTPLKCSPSKPKPRFWETKEYKALQAHWYQKLEAAGFEDAECLVNGKLELQQTSWHVYREHGPTERETRYSYYAAILSFAVQEEFECEADRIIMMMIGEGARIKDVSCVLKAKDLKCHRQTIRYVIRHFEMKWGMKTYLPRQLSSKIA